MDFLVGREHQLLIHVLYLITFKFHSGSLWVYFGLALLKIPNGPELRVATRSRNLSLFGLVFIICSTLQLKPKMLG